MRVVSNSGPLIHLSWIDYLNLLPALFAEVLVPPAVHREVMCADPNVPGVTALRAAFAAGWLRVRAVGHAAAVARLAEALDAGEAEALALAIEARADLLLVDERRGRLHAQREGMPITGTIGVLRLARERGLLPSVTPLLRQLRGQGFRVSDELVRQITSEESDG